MFEIGPHLRDAFALDGRRRGIAEAVEKLAAQGVEARYEAGTRQIQATAPGEGTEVLLFDDGLRLSGVLRPSGRTTRIEYPKEHCLRVTTPAGIVTEAEVLGGGRDVALRQSGAGAYRLRYDDMGRVAGVTYPGGAGYKLEWGPDNVPVSLTDRLGARWQWQRDKETGHLSVMTDPLGREVRFLVDAEGRPARVTDAAGREHRFEHGDGFLEVSASSGAVTRLDRTAEDVIEVRWAADEGVREHRDGEQRLVRAEDLHSEDFVAFEHDDAGRIVSESTPEGKVGMKYDEAGRLVSLEGVHDDGPIAYEYDPDGYVIAVTGWHGHRIEIARDADGRISRVVHPGGVVESRQAGACGRVSRLEVHARGGANILRQAYEYDDEERLVGLHEQVPVGRKRRFNYDAESHLVEEVDAAKGKAREKWSYDLKGNMTVAGGATIELAPDDRPLSIAGRAIEWDANGCATRLPGLAKGREVGLTFGASQRLHAARPTTGVEVRFHYDPIGRRTSKECRESVTRFRWCRHQLVRQTTTGSDGHPVLREWIYLPESYTPIALRVRRAGVEHVFSVHEDCRGAVIALVDEKGRLAWHGQYDAFGACTEKVAYVEQPWRLMGQYEDAETGLHYNQARYYSPVLGTYLSRDPRWLEWEATNYSYGRNDPWNRGDPTGAVAVFIAPVVGAVVGGIVGGVVAIHRGGDVSEVVAAAVGGATAGFAAIASLALGVGAGLAALAGIAAGAIGEGLMRAGQGEDEVCIPCVLKNAAVATVVPVVAAPLILALAPFAPLIAYRGYRYALGGESYISKDKYLTNSLREEGHKTRESMSAAKAKRRRDRQSLITAGKNSGDAALRESAERLERDMDAVERARLSKHVYDANDPPNPAPDVPLGYVDPTPDELKALGLKADDLSPTGSSFRAKVYKVDSKVMPVPPEYVIAYRGTKTDADWIENARQGMGLESDHYARAMNIADEVQASGVSFEVTGHSLGGGMASAAGVVTGVKGTTFNAAGLHGNTTEREGKPLDRAAAASRLDAYRVEGEKTEILSSVNKVPGVPDAIGNPRGIPPPTDDLSRISQHDMDVVIDGLERQKRDDEGVLNGCVVPQPLLP
jgi:RHS repeat-associated protein